MKRSQFLALIATVALSVVLVASIQPVFSQGGGGGRKIVLIDRDNDDHELPILDAGRRHFSPGDLQVFKSVLYNKNRKAGNLTARCSVLKAERRSVGFLCDGIAGLEDGKITFMGHVGFGEGHGNSHLAITGGTGGFDQASGGITLTPQRHSTKITLNVKTG